MVCAGFREIRRIQALNFSRNAILWIIIALLLFALFNLFQGTGSQQAQRQILAG